MGLRFCVFPRVKLLLITAEKVIEVLKAENRERSLGRPCKHSPGRGLTNRFFL